MLPYAQGLGKHLYRQLQTFAADIPLSPDLCPGMGKYLHGDVERTVQMLPYAQRLGKRLYCRLQTFAADISPCSYSCPRMGKYLHGAVVTDGTDASPCPRVGETSVPLVANLRRRYFPRNRCYRCFPITDGKLRYEEMLAYCSQQLSVPIFSHGDAR